MLDIEGFRKAGYAAIDAVCDYYASLEERDVVSSVEPGYLEREHIHSDSPPVDGESWDVISADFQKAILPGITHWQSPNFMAYFPANQTFESIVADIYASAVSNPGFNWSCSPACTELESKVVDWAGKMLGLEAGGFLGNTGVGGGCIMGSASEACLTIAIGARERALLTLHQQALAETGLPATELSEIPRDIREKYSQKLIMYGSTQTHSIGAKAASILGHRFRALKVTKAEDMALRGEVLRQAIEEDVAKGFLPFMVIGTIGTTSSGAIDHIAELGTVTRDYPTAHFHVDAAWAGMMYACPEMREKGRLNEVNEFAGSFSVNPHKNGLVGFDCTGTWVKDRTFLTNALSLTPEYLKTKHGDTGTVIDYRNWNLSLGRRFRSLKLWFVLRSYGVSGFQAHIRNGVDLVDRLAAVIAADSDFVLPTPPSFSLLTFQLAPAGVAALADQVDVLNRRLHERLSARRDVLLTQTILPEVGFCIRLAVGTPSTRWAHVERVWAAVREEADAVLAAAS